MAPRGNGGLASFFRFLRDQKNHSAGENTVGTHRALRNMDKAIEPRSVSFQFPGAPSSMGSSPLPLSALPPSTFDDIPIYSQLLAGTLYDQIPSLARRSSLYTLYLPFRYSVPFRPSLLRALSRYLILFRYIFILFFGLIYRRLPRTIYIPAFTKCSR